MGHTQLNGFQQSQAPSAALGSKQPHPGYLESCLAKRRTCRCYLIASWTWCSSTPKSKRPTTSWLAAEILWQARPGKRLSLCIHILVDCTLNLVFWAPHNPSKWTWWVGLMAGLDNSKGLFQPEGLLILYACHRGQLPATRDHRLPGLYISRELHRRAQSTTGPSASNTEEITSHRAHRTSS